MTDEYRQAWEGLVANARDAVGDESYYDEIERAQAATILAVADALAAAEARAERAEACVERLRAVVEAVSHARYIIKRVYPNWVHHCVVCGAEYTAGINEAIPDFPHHQDCWTVLARAALASKPG